jgi:hypothetical protein
MGHRNSFAKKEKKKTVGLVPKQNQNIRAAALDLGHKIGSRCDGRRMRRRIVDVNGDTLAAFSCEEADWFHVFFIDDMKEPNRRQDVRHVPCLWPSPPRHEGCGDINYFRVTAMVFRKTPAYHDRSLDIDPGFRLGSAIASAIGVR